ncbi:hypothetical protein [Tahibacter harae]|uniref:SPOR domain-containing protein n=1 Tax=Tahibacter harae TaxID=2963937 RepID=A0ABT1QSL4_9GAMM|nr:hypothetical protein [Tahibacter harae]MCQ4165252.1 hypothetical protein [Tahibacter harae]
MPLRRELLHELRWRPPDINWRRVVIALAAALLAHLILILLVRDAMKLKPFVEDRRGVIRVTLIERAPPPEIAAPAPLELPPLAVPAPQGGSARNAPAPVRRERGQRQVPAAAAAEQGADAVIATPSLPSLYNPDGSLRTGAAAAPAVQARTPLEKDKAVAAEMSSRGHNVIRCKRTRFANAYSPDESVGDKAARKYLGWIGLYNPARAKRSAELAMEARENCDSEE